MFNKYCLSNSTRTTTPRRGGKGASMPPSLVTFSKVMGLSPPHLHSVPVHNLVSSVSKAPRHNQRLTDRIRTTTFTQCTGTQPTYVSRRYHRQFIPHKSTKNRLHSPRMFQRRVSLSKPTCFKGVSLSKPTCLTVYTTFIPRSKEHLFESRAYLNECVLLIGTALRVGGRANFRRKTSPS